MEFKIHGDEPKKKEIVYFKLVNESGIKLVACDESGLIISYILGIKPNGLLMRCSHVSRELGLSLDSERQIREED